MARNKDSKITTDELFDQGRENDINDIDTDINTVEEIKETAQAEKDDIVENKTDIEPSKSSKKTSSKKSKKEIPAKKTRRLNLTLTEENYKFIKMQSIEEDTTATDIINRLIEEYKKKKKK